MRGEQDSTVNSCLKWVDSWVDGTLDLLCVPEKTIDEIGLECVPKTVASSLSMCHLDDNQGSVRFTSIKSPTLDKDDNDKKVEHTS